jgi:hypothetical protein
MIKINLDYGLSVEPKRTGIEETLNRLEGFLPARDYSNLIVSEGPVSGDELAETRLPNYVKTLDQYLDMLQNAFLDGEQTASVAKAYVKVRGVRDQLVDEVWKLAGTNRVNKGSLRYVFMSQRSVMGFESDIYKLAQ